MCVFLENVFFFLVCILLVMVLKVLVYYIYILLFCKLGVDFYDLEGVVLVDQVIFLIFYSCNFRLRFSFV